MSHQPTYCHKKWWRIPVLPLRFSMPIESKNCNFNLALEMGGFSPEGTTSLLLLKPHHNMLFCNPITNQYIFSRISYLFHTLVWRVLIWMEVLFRGYVKKENRMFMFQWILHSLKYEQSAIFLVKIYGSVWLNKYFGEQY